MFIFTAKLNRKKAIAIVLALAVVLCAIILLAGRRDQSARAGADATGSQIRNEEDIVEYLGALGWEVEAEPIEVQEILIPRQFTDVYESYNDLQRSCGFDLSEYQGIDAVRYTYRILNYPDGQEDIVADILVANHAVIGGDIQSIHLDGFMHGLTKNQEAA